MDGVDLPDSITSLFTSIWGIGKVDAIRLYNAGFKTLNDLREGGEGYLKPDQILGLKYYDDLKQPIPRASVERFAKSLRSRLIQYNPNLELIIAGSYRRGKSLCGDIDCIVYDSKEEKEDKSKKINFVEMIYSLICQDLIQHTLVCGKTRFMGLSMIDGRMCRLDICCTKLSELPYALLTHTGNKTFNIQMRILARRKGYRLSQYGLEPLSPIENKEKIGERNKIKYEKEIFEFLGFKYLLPTERSKDRIESLNVFS